MADLTSRRDHWTDALPQSWQQSINTNPLLNALGRALQRSSPDMTRGIEYDQYGSVSDRNWLLEQAAGGPPKLNPLAADMIDKGNLLAMFLGPGARIANRPALARAQQKAAAGMPREQIWKEEGWFQGPDGKWRFEISDLPTWAVDERQFKELPRAARSANPTLGNAFKHDEYFSAYPEARDMLASFHYGARPAEHPIGGYFRPGMRQDGTPSPGAVQSFTSGAWPPQANLRSTVLHELQHDAQYREGFAVGGSPRSVTPSELAAERARLAAIPDPDPSGWTTVSSIAGDMPDAQVAHGLYRRLAGEVEARATQQRWNMTPEERRARAPWLDYDVPEHEQIVKFK